MSWTCSSCGFDGNSDEVARCICGYELPLELDYLENMSPYEFASVPQRFLNSLIDHAAMVPIMASSAEFGLGVNKK